MIAVSGTGNSYATTLAAVSGTGYAGPAAAGPVLAMSGTGNADWGLITVSGTGNAYSNDVAVSGGTGAVTVQGTNVTAELLLGVLEELEIMETPEIEIPVDLPEEEDPFAQTNGPDSASMVPSSFIVETLKSPDPASVGALLTDTSSSGQTTRCRSTMIEIRAKSGYGNRLWSYFQKVSRCYNGSRLSQVFRTRWAEVYASSWEFVGHLDNSEYGGNGQWSYSAFTQGGFKLCPGPWGCWQNKTPWIEQRVTASGSHSVDYFGG